MTDNFLAVATPHLDRLGAAAWIPVLRRWLEQYQGLHSLIQADSTSLEQQVLAVLEQLVFSGDADLADRLARLDFLTWRARAGSRPWNPLEQTFEAFQSQWPEIHLWQSDREFPPPETTARWLLDQLKEQQ